MSEMSSYSALRFKFNKKFESVNDFYNFIKGYIGEPEDKTFESKWNGDSFDKTDKIQSFYYTEDKDCLVPRCIGDDWYLDYVLEDIKTVYDDISVTLDVWYLSVLRNNVLKKFDGFLVEDCKLKVVEWYNGGDMPLDF